MGLFRYVLYWCAIVAVNNAYHLNDFDLPGIFSKHACSNSILREKLQPVCRCREKTPISDIDSLCRSYEEFGNCVELEIQKDPYGSEYLTHVFSNTRLKQIMGYLCRIKSDATGITTCTKPEVPLQCNMVFINATQKSHNVSEKAACRFTEKISECYWRIYENECSPKVRYFWYTLSESYMATKCSKHSIKSKGNKCIEIKNAFHPNSKTHSKEECHKAVHTMRQCFEFELLSSLHHDDIWSNMEFELDRFTRFQRLRCDVKKEKDRNHRCEYPHRKRLEHCINVVYMDGFKKQTEELRNGRNVTVAEICSVYDATTQCIQEVLKDCTVNAMHLNSLFCGSMPASCYCPVNIEAEIMARSSGTSRLTTTSLMIMFCLYISIHALTFKNSLS